MTEKLRKRLITVLKIVVSAALIYFIFTKINLKDVVSTLKDSNPIYLFLGVILFILSKILAAFRLNLYFHQIDVRITQFSNQKLYLLGMFYNLFLPGGIGGDAYKGYVIHKKYQSGTKKVVGVLLLDRLSGMLLIFIYICILAMLLQQPIFQDIKWLVAFCIPLSLFTFWLLNKKFFSYSLPVFWKSLGYSSLVQGTQLICILCILKSLSISWDIVEYLFVFLVSSIVSVIPLTIGGIGSREVTFLYGAKWLELDANTSIGISFVFFLITALISFFGIFYHFKKPQLETVS
ncbi:lysylphosphatidylglycerol synthase transmembrane domain-containing protein [Flagellimonas algicola]|uniref:Flippase-like domain-containing protein n=1 Tax=Flagellimonas algicola TaxID=2583815 RepID=A0ABY2WQC2_9FLAO|nr:lysylphosphatidylglycerol synthase transmembrane domain-containing protein [Allomuricauda algicola]TMU57178.1 flippase-like domain-containing protein [Allomuricauda algicola]